MGERVHELKTWPEPFAALVDGRKRFEVRQDDRGYMVGDLLLLREWDPTPMVTLPYSGRALLAPVVYIVHGGRFGLPSGLCVMGLGDMTMHEVSDVSSRVCELGVRCCDTKHDGGRRG